jgi:hypothetical protein
MPASAPPKQRHTPRQVDRRLRDERGYTEGYGAVRRYIGKHQRRQRETFIPPGRMEDKRCSGFAHSPVMAARLVRPILLDEFLISPRRLLRPN